MVGTGTPVNKMYPHMNKGDCGRGKRPKSRNLEEQCQNTSGHVLQISEKAVGKAGHMTSCLGAQGGTQVLQLGVKNFSSFICLRLESDLRKQIQPFMEYNLIYLQITILFVTYITVQYSIKG